MLGFASTRSSSVWHVELIWSLETVTQRHFYMENYCLSFFLCDRLLKFLLPRLVSTVMPSVTLLGLIFSLPRSLKILCPLPTTVMYASCFFGSVISFFIGTFPVLKFCLFVFFPTLFNFRCILLIVAFTFG